MGDQSGEPARKVPEGFSEQNSGDEDLEDAESDTVFSILRRGQAEADATDEDTDEGGEE
jgi:hypothetical protein